MYKTNNKLLFNFILGLCFVLFTFKSVIKFTLKFTVSLVAGHLILNSSISPKDLDLNNKNDCSNSAILKELTSISSKQLDIMFISVFKMLSLSSDCLVNNNYFSSKTVIGRKQTDLSDANFSQY